MDKPELPDKIIPISMLRTNWDNKKKNLCEHGEYEVDVTNKEVTCVKCGANVNPFDAIFDITRHYEKIHRDVERLLEERKQILNWQPHLVALRELERIYRGGTMLPCCPHCGRGVEASELTRGMVNKRVELERRRFEKGEV